MEGNFLMIAVTYAYSNNGMSFRAVAPDYVVTSGEVLFDHIATASELTSVFSGYTTAVAEVNKAITISEAFAFGLTVSSTSTPALNGTYSITPTAIAYVDSIVASIDAGRGLPGGQSTFIYKDSSGGSHSFSSANFLNLAVALRDYVYNLNLYMTGDISTLPLASATIA
jgi:hypothetical protein